MDPLIDMCALPYTLVRVEKSHGLRQNISLHGNFKRLEEDRGFEFYKGEFGAGKFRLKASKDSLLVEDQEQVIASVEADLSSPQLKQLELSLLQELEECENGELFLEVIGGADYLKDFLDKIINEEPR